MLLINSNLGYLFLLYFISSSLFCTVYSVINCNKFSEESRSTCELMNEADKAEVGDPLNKKINL